MTSYRALSFCGGVLGFELTHPYGRDAAFISAGGYHHHIGLNTWESRGGSPPRRGSTGLFHLAILYPTRTELADALLRLKGAGVALDGASDHGVSEALYLTRSRSERCRTSLRPTARAVAADCRWRTRMFTRPLDLDGLLVKQRRLSAKLGS